VPAPVEQLFDLLDDPHLLAAHMQKRSWRMAWGRFDVSTDAGDGRRVGSHIRLEGRVLGLRLGLDEVVVVRDRPTEKRWETSSPPRLLVIGHYRLGFRLSASPGGTQLTVGIGYDLPARGVPRQLGRLFANLYARWCLSRMADEASRRFPDAAAGNSGLSRPTAIA
jgi:hypothetical protein